jgi:hypothetical protein
MKICEKWNSKEFCASAKQVSVRGWNFRTQAI